MVVVAIVAILAMMAAPSYRDMIERNRLRGAADDVLSLIANTRGQAVKNGLDVRIVTTADPTAWCVGAESAAVPSGGVAATGPATCVCGTAGDCKVDDVETVVSASKHPRVAMAAGTAFIIDGKLGTAFEADGTFDDLGSIRLTSENYEVRVNVTPLGQATLCTPTTMAGIRTC